ncbi:SusC/RagA family TonB-linked outer membrane protein [Mariniflexile sp.]|uniref:SusC/RagA family TonB-linked outer membrane protein n=3 Tax=Mariniflexile sp. TaxID=1979402 RepID=UPI0040489930
MKKIINSWEADTSFLKLDLKMKLTLLFFVCTLFQLSASSSYSQATKLTLDMDKVTVNDVIREIESLSEFKFLYNRNEIDLNRVISIKVNKKRISDILSNLFINTDTKFEVFNKQIILKKASDKDGKELVKEELIQSSISGIITDASGVPLPGANIIEKGTTNGTQSDFDGNFSLTLNNGNAILIISYIGFLNQEISIHGQTSIKITLQEDSAKLDEVIVVGYGTQKKSDLTGAVSSVKEDQLVAYPSTNGVQALQGRASGVVVQSNNGDPGGDFKISIRGSNSINASSSPLFVVDGLVGGILPPAEDIQSIEVLKDASATAIYGSRGANGVVLVTTKTGKEGKVKISYNTYGAFQKEIGRVDVLNAQDFSAYINEARGTDFYDLNNITADTDWQDLIFRFGFTQNHQLSLSGGSEKVKFYVSGIYFDQTGVIEKSSYKRISLTSNLNAKISDRLRVNLNSIIQSSNRNGVPTQTSGVATNSGVITSAQRFEPNVGILDENGDYTISAVGIAAFENPRASIDGRDENTRNENVQLNLKSEFDITDNLLFTSTFGVILTNNRFAAYYNKISNQGQNTDGQANLSYRRNSNFLTEQYLTYKFNLGDKNNFNFTNGYSYQKFDTETFSAGNTGFITDAFGFWNLGAGTNLLAPDSGKVSSEIVSGYSRLNYNHDDRYLLTFTGRYDGASQFSEGNKWSFFPSGAFSWNISNEKFYPENSVISNLKFRSSYGLTGNQAISPYQSFSRISPTYFVLNDASVSSIRPTAIANSDLTWETTAQFNIGIDAELLKGRISLSADYYNKQTSDLLFSVPIPSFSGFQTRLENLGKIENKGYEFQIQSKNLINDFKWSTIFNISSNKNKILSLPNGEDIIISSAPSLTGSVDNSILSEGHPVGSFYGYVYEGVYQVGDTFIPGGTFETTPGGEKYADLNGDGVLNTLDREIIGDPNPKFDIGFNNDFSYKGISLNIFFQGALGGDVLNLGRAELDRLTGNNNATTDALNRWTPTNTVTNIPKATTGRVPRTSTRFVEDGSYFRLKNVSLGYDLPSSLLEKLHIGATKIYISGQNLLTFTNYSGVDPEVAFRSSNTNLGLDYGSYPSAISYTLGLNLSF